MSSCLSPETDATSASDLPPARRTVDVWPDAARMLGVSRNTAYAMARSGQLPVIRVGRRLLVPIAKLNELLGERA